jgi:uncharacterized protein (DUF58 family)
MRLAHLAEAMRARSGGSLTGLPGNFVYRRHGRGLETHDIRHWSQGDDIRHIDRNATARTGVPHVRSFRDERDRVVLLIADFRPSMLFGTRRALRSVAAAETLALIGWQASAEGSRVGALAIGAGAPDVSPAGHGPRLMAGVLGLLARAHTSALAGNEARDPPLSATLEAAARLTPAGAVLCVATGLDTPGDDFDSVTRWLARRNELQFVVLRDAFEEAPPRGDFPVLRAGGSQGVISIGRRVTPRADDRCARLAALGARAVFVEAWQAPEVMAAALEGLQGAAPGLRHG